MAPDRSRDTRRYLVAEDTELDDFATSTCYGYLQAPEADRRQLENLIDDDDCLWFFEQFIHCQCERVGAGEREGLLLGLTAVAFIGLKSDPRDVSTWVYDLYKAAASAAIPSAIDCFKAVGALASPRDHSGQWGPMTVAGAICQGFEEGERSDACQRKKGQVELVNRFPPLIDAAARGDVVEIFDLLRQGADVNMEVNGVTALAMAAFAKKEHTVDMLLNAGARVDARPHGMTLLEFARLGDPDNEGGSSILDCLKQHGAS